MEILRGWLGMVVLRGKVIAWYLFFFWVECCWTDVYFFRGIDMFFLGGFAWKKTFGCCAVIVSGL